VTLLATLIADLIIRAVTGPIDLALGGWSTTRPQSHGASRWANWRDRRRLGRVTRPERAAGDGIALGYLGRRLLQSPAEDNVLLLGVQRSGKTSTVVVPTLLTWAGAAIATSTKEELVRLTAMQRAHCGPVWVFAPLDRDTSWIEDLGLQAATWNPIASITDCGSAAELADHFTASGKRGMASHWYLSASNLITALAVFANERGGDMGSVLIALNRTAQADFQELSKVVEDARAADLLMAHALTRTARQVLLLPPPARVLGSGLTIESAAQLRTAIASSTSMSCWLKPARSIWSLPPRKPSAAGPFSLL
jgi:type IV secretory pathway TraG/TraD family ATPase VirD4